MEAVRQLISSTVSDAFGMALMDRSFERPSHYKPRMQTLFPQTQLLAIMEDDSTADAESDLSCDMLVKPQKPGISDVNAKAVCSPDVQDDFHSLEVSSVSSQSTESWEGSVDDEDDLRSPMGEEPLCNQDEECGELFSGECSHDSNSLRLAWRVIEYIEQEIQRNSNAPLPEDEREPSRHFWSLKAQPITVRDYIRRIVTYFDISAETMLLALIYMKKLARADKFFALNAFNAHRIILCVFMIACKYMYDDRRIPNLYFGKAGGISRAEEINRLERVVLRVLDYNLFVGPKEFHLAGFDIFHLYPNASSYDLNE
eukprot:CAMPEP_0184693532 /NCGR_PEP_ID=MMETSP0313-20130426/1723_1 /TAXON_ID=2792 /ORGANISM="Porphyridium aerugineum, Strain SAG 1380-2" /LENGTH=313 /DNA_ID=CAMNT_0027151625 /DNA_START=175 /DNA_END=1116 /DNA_ORIENTATION=-